MGEQITTAADLNGVSYLGVDTSILDLKLLNHLSVCIIAESE